MLSVFRGQKYSVRAVSLGQLALAVTPVQVLLAQIALHEKNKRPGRDVKWGHHLQWGSEIWTSLDFGRSKRGWFVNVLHFE